eukprot:657262-Heterocapsa_arctica.AAC.1
MQEVEKAALLAERLIREELPLLPQRTAEARPMPALANVKRAKAWVDQAKVYDMPGPMRGIDYMIARAAVDSHIDPLSSYDRFLVNSLQACRPD